MLYFEHPECFFLILLIPILIIFRKIGFFVKPAFPIILSDWNGYPLKWEEKSISFFSAVSKIFCVIGFLSVVIALSEPVVSKQEKVFTSRGTNIMFVLDTSPSMSAVDIAGVSRLDAAKQTIALLVKQVPGASFGLVSMASEAVVLVPPTMDYDVFLSSLNSINAGELGDGTALGTGISTAVYHLISSKAPKKCIVLLTDGENNSGSISPDTAARIASSSDITLYAVGLGTTGAVPIEYVDPKTGKVWSGFLDSQFDDTILRQTASSGNGLYFPVETLSSLSTALSAVSSREGVVQTFRYKNTNTLYYKQFLLVALVSFSIAWIICRFILKELI